MVVYLSLEPKVIIADGTVSMVDASLRVNFRKYNFKNNQNISVLYITHDLTTAHQLYDDIMILYKGNMLRLAQLIVWLENLLTCIQTLSWINSFPRP